MNIEGKKIVISALDSRGFTLIELVMVLVLIGIVSAYVLLRGGDTTGMKAGAFEDKLRADIRYAQDLGMTSTKRSRVYFNGTGTAPPAGYTVVQDTSATGNCSTFVPSADPALTGNLTITLNTGKYAGITVAPSITCLEFGSLGQPFDCSANLGICSAASSGMTVDVNGSAAMRVTVTVQTGAVN